VDSAIVEQQENQTKYWCEVLRRLISVIKFLGRAEDWLSEVMMRLLALLIMEIIWVSSNCLQNLIHSYRNIYATMEIKE
jgi:hypothetical protein